MIRYFAARYSARVHSLLLTWNSLAAFYVGSSDFRDEVATVQHALRLPTWGLALFTGLVNVTLAYRAWNKQR
ncbi:MAG: hypothetical protein WA419_14745 [Silvibacterium sp.]